MVHHVNFTPGPSQLYFTVADHVREAFRKGIPSISHRSKQFEQISREATDGLRMLLGVPENFQIFFTSSATEVWERIFQNLVIERSFHLVNGSFSKRFHEIGVQLNKKSEKIEAQNGEGFAGPIDVPAGAELIAVTHNETSTGVSLPLSLLKDLRTGNPEAIIAVDAVSSLPYPAFDFNHLDTLFFSVQKGFGMPAGLGVWLVNDRCIARSETLIANNISTGSYHNIATLLAHAKKHQTPETPNVLGIYLLGRVIQDFLRRGIDNIRKETDYKAAVAYQALDNHPLISAFVKDKQFRSRTVIVANTGDHTAALSEHLKKRGLHPGSGYGSAKSAQLRFANFPTHSKEQFELLVDSLADFRG